MVCGLFLDPILLHGWDRIKTVKFLFLVGFKYP